VGQYQGEIAFLDERSGKSKKPPYRPYTMYNIKLKLDSGELSPGISAGFEKPTFNKGDYVVIQTRQDGQYERVDTIAAADRPVPSKPVAAGSSSVSGETAGDGQADRQTQIVLQHSQEMAIAEVALLIANNALPLSSAAGKAGTVKRFEEIHKAVQKLTVELFFDVVTGRLLESVADAGDVVVADVGSLPAAANDASATGTDD
jgi:hypothetical protein